MSSTETRLQRYAAADSWPADESLAAMLENQFNAYTAVQHAITSLSAAVEASAERLRQHDHGRLIYAGAGASARLAVQDGVELYPTFQWPHHRLAYLIAGGEGALTRSVEGAEDDIEQARRDIEALAPCAADILIAVAASGHTPYTCTLLEYASGAGSLTVALANNPGTRLLRQAQHPILLATGGEFLAGSTRMSAGTAQKMALNLFSTQLMMTLGRIHQGYMVDVSASNAKLRRRAQQIIAALADVSAERAATLWQVSGQDIKVAVLMADTDMTCEQASALLQRHHGRLGCARQALQGTRRE